MILKYLMMIRDCRIILETGMRLATPFVSMLFAYYLISFEYLVIGTIMYGGDVTFSEAPDQANDLGSGINIIWNFNDFCNSFMVLTLILVTNNWNDVVDQYITLTEDRWEWAALYSRVYFSFFFYIVALIIVNIITSFVVEIYDDLSDEIDLSIEKTENTKKLLKGMPDGEGLEQLLRQASSREKQEIERETEVKITAAN